MYIYICMCIYIYNTDVCVCAHMILHLVLGINVKSSTNGAPSLASLTKEPSSSWGSYLASFQASLASQTFRTMRGLRQPLGQDGREANVE